ncbi:phage holin family protein [Microvirga terricola]|uniref:Phage holin family protein n=1 Tax=Microvirga terricola TaxID=2719797 RepID=A0ABX0V8G3_9HYPH|nr:phage holin family protein [Microvirga terricola]NIX76142.1 phage holin family protein [Microvirga terricola]
MPDHGHQTIRELAGEALRDTSDLAQKELALFLLEVSEQVRAASFGVALIIAAAVFAIGAIVLWTQALVDWLATVLGSAPLAALVVGGVMALIATALALYGRRVMAGFSLAPRRTMRSLQRDAAVLSERVTG